MSVPFDQIATLYDTSVPSLPRAYIELIQRSFNLVDADHILDVGCGSGDLALALSQISSHIQGVDSSKEMLKIAYKRDTQMCVDWFCCPIEDFCLSSDSYKLIISFEAFHLFPNSTDLIQRFASALKRGGYLCIGWANFEWEQALQPLITNIFASYGISWDDWGFWSCPNLPTLISYNTSVFSTLTYMSINVTANTHVADISNYLVSTSKAFSLNLEERKCLLDELEIGLKEELQSEWSCGVTTYSFAYCVKL